MAATPDTSWIVGLATELGALEERIGDADATIRETWPARPDAGIVALVESGPAAADEVAAALDADSKRFDDEEAARQAAQDLATGQ